MDDVSGRNLIVSFYYTNIDAMKILWSTECIRISFFAFLCSDGVWIRWTFI